VARLSGDHQQHERAVKGCRLTIKDTTGTLFLALTCSVTEANRTRLTALVSGLVQGVGYREFVRRNALDLELAGYAENLGDGRVEVVAEGRREDLELLLVRLRMGPAHAEVGEIEVGWGEGGGLERFYVY
jgi:acylphosphatase